MLRGDRALSVPRGPVERPIPNELRSARTLSGGVPVHDVHPQGGDWPSAQTRAETSGPVTWDYRSAGAEVMRPAPTPGSGPSIINIYDHRDIMRYSDVCLRGPQRPPPRHLGTELLRNYRESIWPGPKRGITVGTEGQMTATISDDRERDADRKARRRDQARHDRAVRRAHGRCQACGVTYAPGSRSRCLVCLERDRRGRRRREGKTTVRPNGRGRRMLGRWGIGSGPMSGTRC